MQDGSFLHMNLKMTRK